MGVREDVGFAELAVTATSDRQEVELTTGREGTVRADGRQVHHTLLGPGPSLGINGLRGPVTGPVSQSPSLAANHEHHGALSFFYAVQS